MKTLAVVGAGSWGTALALVLAPRFDDVRLWAYEPDLAERMQRTRENDVYLPGVRLEGRVRIGSDLAEALGGANVVLSVTPSHVTRGLYGRMLPHLSPESIFVSATKGLEMGTLLRMSEVIQEVTGPQFTPRLAVLSGPTFARDVAAGHPTALVIASRDEEVATAVQTAFSGSTFRLYRNRDVAGVELGASLKNVIAIAAGICAGLGLGSNSMAALITRGLAEITRLAVAMGGQAGTLAGLAGMGDLVLTCTGDLSRNRQVGLALAEGRSLQEIVAGMRMVAEGVKTTEAAVALAGRHGVEMPITEKMQAIFSGTISPPAAIRELMERSLKNE
jgi:glycerol-3-phosphate dehydrogenase (NAD(P)+)